MRLNAIVATQMFEALEANGIDRARLVSEFGPEAARPDVEWNTFAALLDRAAEMLGGDVERLRGIGRALVHAPSWALIRTFARTVVSLPNLYGLGGRWLAPANFPHIPLDQVFLSD